MGGKNSNKNNQNGNVSNEERQVFEEAKASLATEIERVDTLGKELEAQKESQAAQGIELDELGSTLNKGVTELNDGRDALTEDRRAFEEVHDNDERVNVPGAEIGVIGDLSDELEFAIAMCNKMLTHADFKGVDASGTNDLSIAYSRMQSAITRLKIARDKL